MASLAASLKYRLGFALRETGQALERVGCVFQGIGSFQENCECPGKCGSAVPLAGH